eukprot:1080156-Pyramimonas_sp.AAC.1
MVESILGHCTYAALIKRETMAVFAASCAFAHATYTKERRTSSFGTRSRRSSELSWDCWCSCRAIGGCRGTGTSLRRTRPPRASAS